MKIRRTKIAGDANAGLENARQVSMESQQTYSIKTTIIYLFISLATMLRHIYENNKSKRIRKCRIEQAETNYTCLKYINRKKIIRCYSNSSL